MKFNTQPKVKLLFKSATSFAKTHCFVICIEDYASAQ